jgi:glucokinase
MRLALDIGGTYIKCASVTDEGEIAHSGKFPSDSSLGTDEFAAQVVEGARGFLKERGHGISMVGAGMAGFTDGKRGIILESPNLPGVKDLELARELRDGLGVPSYVDNDATVAAWGEYLFGGHGDMRNVLVVTLGTGIGGGLVLDGRLFRGSRGMAGEIGQMVLHPEGPGCRGGGRGCLEYYVGKEGLMRDYAERAGLTEPVEPKIIHDRAGAGEREAREAWAAYGSRLGVVFASAANLLDLDAVILTGGIAGAWDSFSESLMATLRDHLITPHKDRLTVMTSSLGGDAGILGAAFLDRAQ